MVECTVSDGKFKKLTAEQVKIFKSAGVTTVPCPDAVPETSGNSPSQRRVSIEDTRAAELLAMKADLAAWAAKSSPGEVNDWVSKVQREGYFGDHNHKKFPNLAPRDYLGEYAKFEDNYINLQRTTSRGGVIDTLRDVASSLEEKSVQRDGGGAVDHACRQPLNNLRCGTGGRRRSGEIDLGKSEKLAALDTNEAPTDLPAPTFGSANRQQTVSQKG